MLDFNLSITNELSDLKKFVSECGDRVEKVVSADESLGESVEKLKNEMNVTWASVVGREIKKMLMRWMLRLDQSRKLYMEQMKQSKEKITLYYLI